jgi:hypothetical protein
MPLRRAGVSKTAKKGLKTLIYPFSLPVGLWVVRRAEAERSACGLEYGLPKQTGEDLVTIRYDRLGHTVKVIHVVQEK